MTVRQVGVVIAVLVGAVVSAGGCLDHGVFRCKVNRDCGAQGFCESNGACSFVDSEGCPSGRRYGRHVQDPLSNRCVDPACPANPVIHVRAGGAHACLVRYDGAVACWGAGTDGQLGDGNLLSRSTVTPVTPTPGLGTAVDIALGDRHTCALLNDMTVWCWGANESGQLGTGDTAARPTPTQVAGLTDVTAIAAGGAFTCAVNRDGSALCWGRNADGELGNGNGTDLSPTPQPVRLLANVQTLTARDRHACALTVGGLLCWGSNEQGELGDGTRNPHPEPTAVMIPPGVTWTDVVAGAAHTCALGTTGQIWCWGANQLGELGDGTDETRAVPAVVPSLTSVTAIAAGGHHTCTRRDDGTVLCWGANHAGQLGEGTTSNFRVPVPVTSIDNGADVTAGNAFSCVRRRDGTVSCWGDDRVGQLGGGTTIESLSPIRVSNLDRAQSITAGRAHTCALRPASDGAASTVCWGNNQAGQLGDGTRLDRPTPVALKISLNARQVVAGSVHTCLRGGDKSVWCWGRGGSGQLGTPALIDFAVPVNVAGLGDVTHIAAGQSHTCGLREQSAWCWGANDEGQLGDGTNLGRSTPIAVPGTPDIVQLALGGAHTCARHLDGTVTCWGRGTDGQLGNNQKTTSATPVIVWELMNAVAIVAGVRHTCAMLADQTVSCWGDGVWGQLGWGSSPVGHEIPSKVVNLADAVEIAAGDNHTCARTSSGNVFCWGANSSGQIGDGTHDTRLEPIVDAPSFVNAIAIAAGGAHTCAIKNDQSVFCWGSDSAGQLGEGAFLQHPTARPTHISCP